VVKIKLLMLFMSLCCCWVCVPQICSEVSESRVSGCGLICIFIKPHEARV